jgi:hypothetical protein
MDGERAISDDGHRIYHMLIRHGLRFGCIIIIGVCSHVSARCTCFEHVTSFMKSMTQMAEERSSHDSSTNECARIQWCIRMNPGPDSSRECCRGIRCEIILRERRTDVCVLCAGTNTCCKYWNSQGSFPSRDGGRIRQTPDGDHRAPYAIPSSEARMCSAALMYIRAALAASHAHAWPRDNEPWAD